MDKIEYSITSRGELKIIFKGIVFKISGELVLKPAKFYADLVSLEKIEELSEEHKKKIIEFIQKDSIDKIGTEIIFD
jgi:hypothetical protein